MTDNDEPTRDELEQRVEQLEATVEKMLPNRRQTLKGMGLLAGGGLLGAAGGSASASTGVAGDIGTDADRPDIFGDAVDANSVSTAQASINELSAVLEKTTDQSVSADTDTTVNWDNQTLDSNLYSYDGSNNTLDVLSSGDYKVDGQLEITNVSDQTIIQMKALVNGSEERKAKAVTSGTQDLIPVSIPLKDLSGNDTLRFDVRIVGTGGDIVGFDRTVFLGINKEG